MRGALSSLLEICGFAGRLLYAAFTTVLAIAIANQEKVRNSSDPHKATEEVDSKVIVKPLLLGPGQIASNGAVTCKKRRRSSVGLASAAPSEKRRRCPKIVLWKFHIPSLDELERGEDAASLPPDAPSPSTNKIETVIAASNPDLITLRPRDGASGVRENYGTGTPVNVSPLSPVVLLRPLKVEMWRYLRIPSRKIQIPMASEIDGVDKADSDIRLMPRSPTLLKLRPCTGARFNGLIRGRGKPGLASCCWPVTVLRPPMMKR
ncbi:unnamed protein product [Linum trigynum]|uniref:Uncharacterized protein n=1 Tax=Linum trigynum TaxID=586398 RepID=A0AAV2D9G0_9ROSI